MSDKTPPPIERDIEMARKALPCVFAPCSTARCGHPQCYHCKVRPTFAAALARRYEEGRSEAFKEAAGLFPCVMPTGYCVKPGGKFAPCRPCEIAAAIRERSEP